MKKIINERKKLERKQIKLMAKNYGLGYKLEKLQSECNHEIQVTFPTWEGENTQCLICKKQMDALQYIDIEKPEPICIDLVNQYADLYEIWKSTFQAFKKLETMFEVFSRKSMNGKNEYDIGKSIILFMKKLQKDVELLKTQEVDT